LAYTPKQRLFGNLRGLLAEMQSLTAENVAANKDSLIRKVEAALSWEPLVTDADELESLCTTAQEGDELAKPW
jgi:hypothetical protein